jgi:ABC-type transporter Mla MlaB component
MKVRKQQIEQRSVDCYGVIGDLSFDTVVQVEKEGFAIITEGGEQVTLDLSQVQACSSAAMALLLSWLRYASKQQKSLIFSGVPVSLITMIEGAQLDSLFTIQN